jgi:hypothetical protein
MRVQMCPDLVSFPAYASIAPLLIDTDRKIGHTPKHGPC